MKNLVFLFLFIVMSCKTADHPLITVTGIAKDAKAGAVLVTENDAFYIDGMDFWAKEYLNKQVTVSGWLTEVTMPKVKDSIQVQTIAGPIKVIKNPRIVYPEGLSQQLE